MTQKKKGASKKKSDHRKFTLRDEGGVLNEAESIIKDKYPKPSLNTYILEAIQEYNKHHK